MCIDTGGSSNLVLFVGLGDGEKQRQGGFGTLSNEKILQQPLVGLHHGYNDVEGHRVPVSAEVAADILERGIQGLLAEGVVRGKSQNGLGRSTICVLCRRTFMPALARSYISEIRICLPDMGVGGVVLHEPECRVQDLVVRLLTVGAHPVTLWVVALDATMISRAPLSVSAVLRDNLPCRTQAARTVLVLIGAG